MPHSGQGNHWEVRSCGPDKKWYNIITYANKHEFHRTCELFICGIFGHPWVVVMNGKLLLYILLIDALTTVWCQSTDHNSQMFTGRIFFILRASAFEGIFVGNVVMKENNEIVPICIQVEDESSVWLTSKQSQSPNFISLKDFVDCWLNKIVSPGLQKTVQKDRPLVFINSSEANTHVRDCIKEKTVLFQKTQGTHRICKPSWY